VPIVNRQCVVPSILPVGNPLDFPLSSDWFRVPRACEYSGLPQSTLYEIMDDPDNQIITFTLKLRKGQKRGIRFILRQSLDAYLERKAREAGINRELVAAE
jgi:hypothetical protein